MEEKRKNLLSVGRLTEDKKPLTGCQYKTTFGSNKVDQKQKNRNDGAGEVGAPTNPMKAQPSSPCKVRGAGASPARGIKSQRKRVDGSVELRAVGIAESLIAIKKRKEPARMPGWWLI